MTTIKKSYSLTEFKALVDPVTGADTGEFEAYVSVFNNVDYQGDRVLPGAFSKSLKSWADSGDPIPISFSHDWSPWSLIGFVDPKNATQDNKGLRVKGQLDIETNPTAAQVYSLLKRRIVKEFSFAYDVVEEQKAKDGANNLIDLNIIEVGPTLKGANEETELVAVKAALEAAATKEGRSISNATMGKLQAAHDTLADLGTKCASNDSEKAATPENVKYFWGAPAGSLEEEQDEVRKAVQAWSNDEYPPNANGSYDYWTCVVATFDDRVVVSVESTEGEEAKYLSLPYTKNDDGTVSLGDPSEVNVELIITPVKATDADAEKSEEVIDLTTETETKADREETEAEHFGAKAVDDSSWDGPAAMSKCADSDAPASYYDSICAGKRDGDPALASSHALPHHKTAGGPANKNGVADALDRLEVTQGLTNEDAARAHLERHQAEYANAEKDYVGFNAKLAELLGNSEFDERTGELTLHGPVPDEETTATQASSKESDEPAGAKDTLNDDLAELADIRLRAEIATFEVAEEETEDE